MINLIRKYKFDHPKGILNAFIYEHHGLIKLIYQTPVPYFMYGKFILQNLDKIRPYLRMNSAMINLLSELIPDTFIKLVKYYGSGISLHLAKWIFLNMANYKDNIDIKLIIAKNFKLNKLQLIKWFTDNYPNNLLRRI